MKRILSFVVLLFTLLANNPVCAETTFRFEHFDVDSGLSQNSVNDIVQDKYGFMWFATQGGLSRFDGYKFTHFKHQPDDAHSLSDNFVHVVFVADDGDIWAGTRTGGLNRFDFASQTFTRFVHDPTNPKSLSHNRITSIVQSAPSELLIGTLGGGVNRFNLNTKNFSTIKISDDIVRINNINQINSITTDQSNQIWIGTNGNGLIRVSPDGKTFKAFTYDANNNQTIGHNFVRSVFVDSSDTLWVATGSGFSRFERQSASFTRFVHQDNHLMRRFLEDGQKRLWVGGNNGINLLSADRSTLTAIKHNASDKHSLSSDLVTALYKSTDNVLWAGTYISGFNKFNLSAEAFHHYNHNANNPNSLNNNIVWHLSQTHNGDILISTDGGGINRFNPKTRQFNAIRHQPDNPNSLGSDFVRSTLEQSPGVLWSGTFDAGVNRIDLNSGQVTRYSHDENDPNSISNNHIMSMLIDSRNNLWVGTIDGLDLFQPTTGGFKHFKHDKDDPHSISDNEITDIIEDNAGLLWVTTGGGGVNWYDPNTKVFNNYRQKQQNLPGLANIITTAALQAHNKDIWLATYGAGIGKLDTHSGDMKMLTKADGLIDNAVLGILESTPDEFWISTNGGLSRYRGSSGEFVNFTVADGLQSDEFNSSAFVKTKDGQLYFGGINGFNHFYPKDIVKSDPALNVRLTQMRVSNQPVAITSGAPIQGQKQFSLSKALYLLKQLTLSHEQSLVSFEFSTLSFTHPKTIEFQYMLENFDKQWINTDHTLRLATYTNIPAGKYRLKVRAKVPHAQWLDNATVLPITIMPAPWRSWWAYMAYSLVLLLVLGMFALQRWRRLRVEHEAQERLSLALWGSHSELWDWDLLKNTIYRSNQFNLLDNVEGESHFDYQQLRELTHKDDIEELIEKFEAHIHNKTEYFDVSYRRLTVDGQWQWYRSRAKAVNRDSDGIAHRIVGTVEDIDELKQVQTELKKFNSELESRVKARTEELTDTLEKLHSTEIQLIESEKLASLAELVVGIAHELNTPLGISLTATTHIHDILKNLCNKKAQGKMKSTDFDQFESTALDGLALLFANINKTIELVQTFKSLSPKTTDETGSSFSLSKLLDCFAEVNTNRSETPLAKLTINCQPKLVITTFANDLIDILLHLLNNAYTHGFVDIDQPAILIEVTSTDSGVTLQFSDNGVGIEQDLLKKIFEPFYTSQRGRCTGLGLPIVYNIIYYRLSGTLTCESQPGHGFCLNIHLPN